MEQIITDIEQLREPVEPLGFLDDTGAHPEEGQEIISKLKEVMETDKSIIALTAPQIGINKRIFCIRFNDDIRTFINPIVTKKDKYKIAPETCVSMPNKEILINRPEDITIVYYNNDFKYEDNKLLGPAARLFDQCANLLDGIVPSDIGLVSDINEDGSLADLTEGETKQVLDIYKQFIAAKLKAYETSIKEDDNVRKVYDRLRFDESVINGHTQVISEDIPSRHMNRAERRAADKQAKKIAKKLGGKK